MALQGDGHPITPVMLGDARLAVEFADEMLGVCLLIGFLMMEICDSGKFIDPDHLPSIVNNYYSHIWKIIIMS